MYEHDENAVSTAMQALENMACGRERIVFGEDVTIWEMYPAAGMHARIIEVERTSEHDDDEAYYARVTFDFSDMDIHNQPFEQHIVHVDHNAVALTAREAGLFEAQETLFVDVLRWEAMFTPVNAPSEGMSNDVEVLAPCPF